MNGSIVGGVGYDKIGGEIQKGKRRNDNDRCREACNDAQLFFLCGTCSALFASCGKGLLVFKSDEVVFAEIASTAAISAGIGHAARTYPPVIIEYYCATVFGRIFKKLF